MSRDKIQDFKTALDLLDLAAQERSEGIRNQAKGSVLRMRPQFKESLETIKEKSAEKLHVVKDQLTEKSKVAAQAVDKHAHKNPWWYVGGAAFFSTFFGFFLGRKSKK